MNKIYLLLTLTFLFHSFLVDAQRPSNLVRIHGTVRNFNNQIEIEDKSEMGELTLPNSERTFTPDSNKNFSISFSLKKPSYFRFGRNILYLTPGDDLTAFIDFNWPDSAVFSGKGSEANEFLKFTPFPKAGSFLEAGDKIKPTFKETVKEILAIAEKRKYSLAQFKTIPQPFRKLEQARIIADILNSLIDIQTYFPAVNRIPEDSMEKFKTDYKKYVQPYIKSYTKKIGFQQSFLQLQVYRDFIPTILKKEIHNTEEVRKIRSWLYAVDLFDQLLTLKEKKDISFFKKQIDSISVPQYKKAVIKTINRIMAFRDGDEAINFEMLDLNNQEVWLNEYKGKVIYVDIWATWCGPCIEEMPFLDSLKEKYKHNQNLVFVSLSIDNNKNSWLNFLSGKNLSANQFVIDRKKLDKYNVITVPRAIIINKTFKVAAMNAPLPSDKATEELLDKLLSQ